jgi:hypothetical protein
MICFICINKQINNEEKIDITQGHVTRESVHIPSRYLLPAADSDGADGFIKWKGEKKKEREMHGAAACNSHEGEMERAHPRQSQSRCE